MQAILGLWHDPEGLGSCTPQALGAVAPGAVTLALHDFMAKQSPGNLQ